MFKRPIIVFEGIEGSGKSLHIKNVSKYLKSQNIPFIKLREPGGSKNSEKIRRLILNNNSTFSKKTDLLLYFAARNENIEKIISKNYKKKVILIDRFTDSTIAYQHYGMKFDKKIIQIINKYLLKNISISFTFLHIVSKKNLINRLNRRKNLNKYDKFNNSFYQNVQNGFVKLSNVNKSKYLLINSSNSINYNKKLIINKIKKLTQK